MESLGLKLQTAREDKGLSLEQVARETHISFYYLKALEQEDFTVFPGEAYLLGFLRNYSEFLSLDSTIMVNLYRNLLLQEQPTPLEALFEPEKKRWPFIVIPIVVILLVGSFFLFRFLDSKPHITQEFQTEVVEAEAEIEEVSLAKEYQFSEETQEVRIYPKDRLIFKNSEEEEFILTFSDIDNYLEIDSSQGLLSIGLGQELFIDFNQDQESEASILLRDFIPQDAASGALVRFYSIAKEPELADSFVNVGEAGTVSRIVETVVLKESEILEPFDMKIIFRDDSLFRYLADGTRRVEKYYNRNEQLLIEGVSQEVFIGASNAGGVALQVSGEDLLLGTSGKVVTRLIRWRYDEEKGIYLLELLPVY